MLFSVSLQTSGIGNASLVSGNTWGDCTSWAEGTGSIIQSINIQQQTLILVNSSSDESYNVGLKDTITNTISTYIIYDTYSNVNKWVEAQTDMSVQNISLQKRTFVQL
jgi:hypothetical protein